MAVISSSTRIESKGSGVKEAWAAALSSSSSASSSSSSSVAAKDLGADNGLSGPNRRVRVVYYLSRGGLLEQPHLLEVPLASSSPQSGLTLGDVKKKLMSIRGKAMPSSFSWSYKRSYRNGYVWQDLCEDGDLIFPANHCEYIIKGCKLSNNHNNSKNEDAADQSVDRRLDKKDPTQHVMGLYAIPSHNIYSKYENDQHCSSSKIDHESGEDQKEKLEVNNMGSKTWCTTSSSDAATQTEEGLAHATGIINNGNQMMMMMKKKEKGDHVISNKEIMVNDGDIIGGRSIMHKVINSINEGELYRHLMGRGSDLSAPSRDDEATSSAHDELEEYVSDQMRKKASMKRTKKKLNEEKKINSYSPRRDSCASRLQSGDCMISSNNIQPFCSMNDDHIIKPAITCNYDKVAASVKYNIGPGAIFSGHESSNIATSFGNYNIALENNYSNSSFKSGEMITSLTTPATSSTPNTTATKTLNSPNYVASNYAGSCTSNHCDPNEYNTNISTSTCNHSSNCWTLAWPSHGIHDGMSSAANGPGDGLGVVLIDRPRLSGTCGALYTDSYNLGHPASKPWGHPSSLLSTANRLFTHPDCNDVDDAKHRAPIRGHHHHHPECLGIASPSNGLQQKCNKLCNNSLGNLLHSWVSSCGGVLINDGQLNLHKDHRHGKANDQQPICYSAADVMDNNDNDTPTASKRFSFKSIKGWHNLINSVLAKKDSSCNYYVDNQTTVKAAALDRPRADGQFCSGHNHNLNDCSVDMNVQLVGGGGDDHDACGTSSRRFSIGELIRAGHDSPLRHSTGSLADRFLFMGS